MDIYFGQGWCERLLLARRSTEEWRWGNGGGGLWGSKATKTSSWVGRGGGGSTTRVQRESWGSVC